PDQTERPVPVSGWHRPATLPQGGQHVRIAAHRAATTAGGSAPARYYRVHSQRPVLPTARYFLTVEGVTTGYARLGSSVTHRGPWRSVLFEHGSCAPTAGRRDAACHRVTMNVRAASAPRLAGCSIADRAGASRGLSKSGSGRILAT